MRPAPPTKFSAKQWRPSADAATALLLALSATRRPFVELVSTRSGAALELGGALRISVHADGTPRLQTRETAGGRWQLAAQTGDLGLLDTERLIAMAIAYAARAHLASAVERVGGVSLAAEESVYCERRLRADLFPEATRSSTLRVVRELLLRQILRRPLLRSCLLVFGKSATFADLADCARAGAPALERLTHEAPNLAPLLAAAVRTHARRGAPRLSLDVLGVIKRSLMRSATSADGHALAEQDWRWLARQPLGVVRRFCETSNDAAHSAGVRVVALRAFASTGITRICDSLLDIDRQNGPLERVQTAINLLNAPLPVRQDFARLLRLVALEAQRRDSAGQSNRHLADDAGYLIDWWLDEAGRRAGRDGPVVAKNATYTSLIRRQQRWHQWLILRDPEAMQSWASHLPLFESQGIRVVPLTDSLMLAREGMEMRHCVASYAADCARGGTRIFALEDVDTGERATLELRRRAWAWFAGQLKGPCNADVSDTMREAADRLAARYTHASRMA